MPNFQYNAAVQVFSIVTPGATGDHEITGLYSTDSSLLASDMLVGDEFYDSIGNRYTIAALTTVPPITSGIITFEVDDTFTNGTPSSGLGMIYRPTTNYGLQVSNSGISAFLNSVARNEAMITADANIIGGNPNESIDAFIESPANKDYTLVYEAKFAFDVAQMDIVTNSGMLEASLQINGVDITGMASLFVTSTNLNATPSGSASLVAGDELILSIANVASALDLQVSIEFTRP